MEVHQLEKQIFVLSIALSTLLVLCAMSLTPLFLPSTERNGPSDQIERGEGKASPTQKRARQKLQKILV